MRWRLTRLPLSHPLAPPTATAVAPATPTASATATPVPTSTSPPPTDTPEPRPLRRLPATATPTATETPSPAVSPTATTDAHAAGDCHARPQPAPGESVWTRSTRAYGPTSSTNSAREREDLLGCPTGAALRAQAYALPLSAASSTRLRTRRSCMCFTPTAGSGNGSSCRRQARLSRRPTAADRQPVRTGGAIRRGMGARQAARRVGLRPCAGGGLLRGGGAALPRRGAYRQPGQRRRRDIAYRQPAVTGSMSIELAPTTSLACPSRIRCCWARGRLAAGRRCPGGWTGRGWVRS